MENSCGRWHLRAPNQAEPSFGTKVGAHETREFPVDYPNAAVSDGFCIIFSHEYAHSLDGNMNQINQFVLLASMISERDRLPLIQISKDGRITKHDGLITSMVWRNYRYVFTFGSGVTIEHIERTHD